LVALLVSRYVSEIASKLELSRVFLGAGFP